MARTAMSEKELRRVEVMARVVSGELQLGDAAVLLQVSYRQAKRLARRYPGGRACGAAAWQRWTVLQSRQAAATAPAGFGPGARKVFRQRGGAFRSHAGGRTLRRRRRPAGAPGNAAPLDAGRRSMGAHPR